MPHRYLRLHKPSNQVFSVSHSFLLDGMLGSLARWLRILGYDTLYYPDREDESLRVEAEKTGRILVTRDAGLVQKALKNGTQSLLIQSDETLEQLGETVEAFNLDTMPKNTRCPRCNGLLEAAEKSSFRDVVPEESFEAFDRFWRCIECDAIYWQGSHWTQILESLSRVSGSKSL